MRENRPYGSEGGEAQLNEPSLPLSLRSAILILSCDRALVPFSASWCTLQRGIRGRHWPTGC